MKKHLFILILITLCSTSLFSLDSFLKKNKGSNYYYDQFRYIDNEILYLYSVNIGTHFIKNLDGSFAGSKGYELNLTKLSLNNSSFISITIVFPTTAQAETFITNYFDKKEADDIGDIFEEIRSDIMKLNPKVELHHIHDSNQKQLYYDLEFSLP